MALALGGAGGVAALDAGRADLLAGCDVRHASGVAALAVDVAVALDLSGGDVHAVRLGALVHDVGKVAVPDAILAKRGPLSEREWAVVRRHPEAGEHLVVSLVPFAEVTHRAVVPAIVRSHHERWDGSGYPDGLAAAQIPLGARIVAVADAFASMRERRPYRRPLRRREALTQLAAGADRQFDPACVAALLAVASPDGREPRRRTFVPDRRRTLRFPPVGSG